MWRWLFAFALLGGVAFVVAHRSEGQEFAQVLRDAEPAWILAGVALQLPTYWADALLWRRPIARHGFLQPLPELVRMAFAKFFVDQFVPTGGVTGTVLVMRSLEKRGVSRAATIRGLVSRLVSYYAANALALAAALLIAWRYGAAPRIVLWIGSAVAFGFLIAPAAMLWLLRKPVKELPRWLRRIRRARPLARAIADETPKVARDPVLLLESIALQLLIFVLDGATLWACLAATGTPVTFLDAFAGFMIGFVTASLAAVPAGVGTFEAGSIAGLGMMGIPAAAALTGTLVFRGLSLWIPLLPGLYYARRESWR